MNQYSYFDHSGDRSVLIFSTEANSIIEADTVAKANGINVTKLACLIGGRLVITTRDAFRVSKLSKEEPYFFYRDGVKILGRSMATFSYHFDRKKANLDFMAQSLMEAKVKNKRIVNIYRYSPDHLFLWVVGNTTTIVKDFNVDMEK